MIIIMCSSHTRHHTEFAYYVVFSQQVDREIDRWYNQQMTDKHIKEAQTNQQTEIHT